MADVLGTIRKLSESDIRAGMQTMGAGILIWIGDELQGIEAQRDFSFAQMDEAVQWLHDAACELYPASHYAQDRDEWHVGPRLGARPDSSRYTVP